MRPTVDEQLAGIDRLLEQVAADSTLGGESARLLRDARRQLGRLRASSPRRRRFMQWDNAATTALLQTVAPVLPNELQATIAQQAEASASQSGARTEEAEAEENDQLRELLADAVASLPEGADGEAARLRIVKHLRARVDANPTLNKSPIIPEEPS